MTTSTNCSKCLDLRRPHAYQARTCMRQGAPPLPKGSALPSQAVAKHTCLLVVIVLLGLIVEGEASPVAPADWRTSAISQISDLEQTLLQKENSLKEMKVAVSQMKEAEERAGRRYVRRAAFDVGSGASKILVADVDMHAGFVPAITKVVFSKKVSILMSEDLQKGVGTAFSSGILQELMQVLMDFKREAEAAGAEQLGGAATAAFRRAENGPEFLKKVNAEGINLKIVSQEQEGALGFLTATNECPGIAPTDMVAWDSGGGSFQISSAEGKDSSVLSWMRSVGSGIATSVLVQQVQGKNFKDCPSPNPVSIPQAQSLVRELRRLIGEPPDWLLNKIRAPGVSLVGVGGDTSIFCLGTQLAATQCFSKAEVLEGIENLCGKTDLQLRLMEDTPAAQYQPHNVIPKLVLLYTVMDILCCEKVLYKQTNGNVPGILLTDEFWE
eukprot:CAMPEP_0181306172 /NCGR_PEP_ID=MMETSP1101-20121128/10147_1 /TAXON_ID=46948 /ORGANISM="Rhodomonas abbreviata, Strain Caron Lab Isolate" /LENGTH=440 /DNA_ID=CAMNT_0023412189 /DNA_START=54 /DNA_END=1376 /DNA_ORIENTATION=+